LSLRLAAVGSDWPREERLAAVGSDWLRWGASGCGGERLVAGGSEWLRSSWSGPYPVWAWRSCLELRLSQRADCADHLDSITWPRPQLQCAWKSTWRSYGVSQVAHG
jgi:hypothetical protein